jgi:hypothetical protein
MLWLWRTIFSNLQTTMLRDEILKKTKPKIQKRNVQKLERDRDVFSRDADRKMQEEEDEKDVLTPPSTEELTAEPTQEELEAIGPVQMEKEAAFSHSKIERTEKKATRSLQLSPPMWWH